MALGIPGPDPLSDLAPPSSPLHMRKKLPGAASTLKDFLSQDFLPVSVGLPIPDVRVRPITPPRSIIPQPC